MKTNFKRIGKQSISIVLAVMMMLSTMLVGMVTSNAANETGYTYNQDYMYVDLSAISKVASGVNYYWDDAFTNYGGWITDKEDLGNYTYKFDFSAIVSHEYFRGFKIVWAGSAGTNIAVPANNNYNCVKVNSDYTLSWTTYSSTEPTEPTTKYTVTVDKNIKNGKVTPSATSLAAGKTFTVKATPNDGYVLDTVTVKDANGNVIEPNTDGTYTMPASNVTVSATFKVKTDVKYSVTYTAPTGEGVVDSSINPKYTTLAAGLAAGTPVTVTVTVNEGYTASLAVAGATVTTSTSGNTYTFTFSMPAKAITVAPKVTKAGENTGTLIPNLYLIYSDSSSKPSDFTQYLNLYYNSDNQVYAYFDESNFDDSKEYCFMISNSKGESTS